MRTVSYPGEDRRGENNTNAIWTDIQAKQIREYRAEGFTYSDIQKLFGGSISTIADVCCGRTYQNAGGPIQQKLPKNAHHTHNHSIML